MNRGDIIGAIEHLVDSSRVLDQLMRMPRENVDNALRLLSDQKAVESLRQLLKTVRSIQNARPHSSPRKPAGAPVADELEPILTELLSDKTRFPTVATMAVFVREVFRVSVPHKKQSRERYIKNVTRTLRGNPKALFHARNALIPAEGDRKDEAYGALYRFIRGRLTYEQ